MPSYAIKSPSQISILCLNIGRQVLRTFSFHEKNQKHSPVFLFAVLIESGRFGTFVVEATRHQI